MPTFTFTDPQGKTYDVAGPEGSTKEQAFQILQQRIGGAAPAAPPKPAPLPPMSVDPTEGMGWGEKALANLGGGIDTTIKGAQQLFGGGPSDEELREKRRIDEHLAKQTTGGGVIQTVGEILPAVPVGMAAALGAPALGLGAVAASPTLAAMGGGALSGALMPVTSDESRLQNTGLGAAGGALAGPALKLLTKAGGGLVHAGQRIGAALPGATGARAAEAVGTRRTADLLRRELGETPLPADVYTGAPGLANPSAAVATQDPRLAALERGSRTGGGQHWQDFDEAAQNARWGKLEAELQGPAELAAIKQTADTVGAGVPYLDVEQKAFTSEMKDFYKGLQQAKKTAKYHGIPAVKAAVDEIERTMKGAKIVTPELVHNIRRTLGKGLYGTPGAGEAGVRAAQSEPFILDIMKSLDNHLDNASGGKWKQWMSDYSDQMRLAEGAKADINIRAKFIDPATGVLRKPATAADSPQVTGAALKQAVAQAGSMKRGVRKGQNILRPQSERTLNEVITDLDRQAILQRAKAASTGGSGSDTASNLASAALMEAMLPTGLGIGNYVRKEGSSKAQQAMQQQLAQLLQDPEALRRFLSGQETQRLLRSGAIDMPGLGVGAGALLTGPNE